MAPTEVRNDHTAEQLRETLTEFGRDLLQSQLEEHPEWAADELPPLPPD